MKKIEAYQSDCGKKFFNKQTAKRHEIICKCWSNPNQKTCISCKFGEFIKDSNGMEDEPQYLQTWRQWDCKNPDWNYDLHYTQAQNDTTKSLCINCPKHKLKTN